MARSDWMENDNKRREFGTGAPVRTRHFSGDEISA
jgi:hypothetical protein